MYKFSYVIKYKKGKDNVVADAFSRSNEQMSENGRKRAEEIKKMHKKVHEVIQKANNSYAKRANKGDEEFNKMQNTSSQEEWMTQP